MEEASIMIGRKVDQSSDGPLRTLVLALAAMSNSEELFSMLFAELHSECAG